MSNAIRQVLNNLGATILAMLLAFAVWIAATLQDDPFETRTLTNVPLTVQGQPEGTFLRNEAEIPDRVSITVRAPNSILADFGAPDLIATLDLSAVQPQDPTPVTIQVTSTNEAVRIEAIEPNNQVIRLEELRTSTAPVEIAVLGEIATGYQASGPLIIPGQVEIFGPALDIARVISVTGSINVEGANEDVTKQVTLTPMDAEGVTVTGLQLTPKQVDVKVAVRRRLGFKPDVEVVPDLRGGPAPGYRMGSVSVNPSTVTLAGLPSVLDGLPGFVETMPISVTSATQNLSQRSALTVPTSVVVVGVNYVTVTVEILPIQSSRAMTSVVEIQGVQSDLLAIPSPSVVDVILEGPDAILAELLPGDVQIILNLFDYPMGTHRIEPDVLAPADVTVVSIIPETIEVVIELAPTPTPPMTVTVTVTPTATSEP
jgi:YbbR domain-containing protein